MKKAELFTIKVTRESINNFNEVAKKSNRNQYEIVEKASVIIKKIFLKNQKSKKYGSHSRQSV